MHAPEDRDYHNYYLSYNLFVFVSGLVGIFINLFFFSQGNYAPVLSYRIVANIVLLVSYALSGYLMRRYYPRHLYLLGLAAQAFLLAAFLILPGLFTNAILFGLVYGLSIGVLFAGNNVIRYDITRKPSRMRFISVSNGIGSVASFVAPTVAGLLIQFSVFTGPYRFLWDFAAAFFSLILSALFVLRIRRLGERRIRFSLSDTAVHIKGYLKFKAYFFLDALFTVPFLLILPIYVFQETNSYLVAGIFGSALMLFDTFGNFGFRKGFSYSGRFVGAAIAGIILSSLLLFVPEIPPPVNAFLFGILYVSLSAPLDNATETEFMNLMDKNKSVNRALFWTNREYYIFAGRMLVLVPMLLLADFVLKNTANFIFILPLLSCYALIYLFILRKRQ